MDISNGGIFLETHVDESMKLMKTHVGHIDKVFLTMARIQSQGMGDLLVSRKWNLSSE